MSYLANRSIYPIVEHHPTSGRLMHGGYSPGMTLRQHYAGLALPEAMKIITTHASAKSPEEQRGLAAHICVQMADALITELEKSKP